MTNVMSRAWEMYKAAGCTSKVEFAEALRLAWAEKKATKKSSKMITVMRWNGTFVAEIVGTHPKYHLDREFLSGVYTDSDGYSGAKNYTYILEEGKVYDVKDAVSRKHTRRGYYIVENGELVEVDVQYVIEYANRLESLQAAA